MRNLIILSLDELHRSQATAWGERMGMRVTWLNPHELTPGVEANAVLCDWDYWTRTDRQRIVTWLQSLSAMVPFVVKGYHIRPADVELLECLGAKLQSGWDPAVFDSLEALLAGADAEPAGEEARVTPAAFANAASLQAATEPEAGENGDFLLQPLDKSEELPEITPQLNPARS